MHIAVQYRKDIICALKAVVIFSKVYFNIPFRNYVFLYKVEFVDPS